MSRADIVFGSADPVVAEPPAPVEEDAEGDGMSKPEDLQNDVAMAPADEAPPAPAVPEDPPAQEEASTAQPQPSEQQPTEGSSGEGSQDAALL
eukprot:4519624-Amphidinium_carterae.1